MADDPALVDSERRRGRGARSNRVGRYESELREAFDDGWESLGELEPFKTEVYRETAKSIIATQRQPRHRLRSVDQPLSRLRARLHLLLCASNARLSRPLAGSRLRDQALRQGERGRSARARARQPALCAQGHSARRRHRPLSADRARASHHALDTGGARPDQSSGRRRHQVGAGRARPGHPRAHGKPRPGQGRDLGDHASTAGSRARWSRVPPRLPAASKRSRR